MKFSKKSLDEGIIPNQFWIKVNLYGNGEEWLLAIITSHEMIHFPRHNFEDFLENYEDRKIEPIRKPVE